MTEIRKMTVMKPEKFCPQLQSMLAECGIAIVFLPHIGGSFLHGATFYDGNKIILGFTVRGQDADIFWFSLFHELGHIILGHLEKSDGTTQEDEDAADQFAEEILLAKKDFMLYVDSYVVNESTILEFSQKQGIDAGIVLGRLQKYGYVEYGWYKSLKTKYAIA